MSEAKYVDCGYCGWYGKRDDLDAVKIHEIHRIGEVKMDVPYWEDRCPECHKDDGINDAAPPCIDCEARPMVEGYDYCAVCAPRHADD